MTRKEAIEMVNERDGKYPTYLGKPIELILEKIDMTLDQYLDMCVKFANKELFDVRDKYNIIPKFIVGV